MSIPANIVPEMTSLMAQIKAASPLSSAPRASLLAMQLNAAQLVNDVQAALVTPSILDTFVAPSDPAFIVTGVLSLTTASVDQSRLALMRGMVGRVASNLDQFNVTPIVPVASATFVPAATVPTVSGPPPTGSTSPSTLSLDFSQTLDSQYIDQI